MLGDWLQSNRVYAAWCLGALLVMCYTGLFWLMNAEDEAAEAHTALRRENRRLTARLMATAPSETDKGEPGGPA